MMTSRLWLWWPLDCFFFCFLTLLVLQFYRFYIFSLLTGSTSWPKCTAMISCIILFPARHPSSLLSLLSSLYLCIFFHRSLLSVYVCTICLLLCGEWFWMLVCAWLSVCVLIGCVVFWEFCLWAPAVYVWIYYAVRKWGHIKSHSLAER